MAKKKSDKNRDKGTGTNDGTSDGVTVARIVEISSTSPKSFEDAVQNGIHRAVKRLRDVRGAWVKEMKVEVADGKISEYRVNLQVTFVLDD